MVLGGRGRPGAASAAGCERAERAALKAFVECREEAAGRGGGRDSPCRGGGGCISRRRAGDGRCGSTDQVRDLVEVHILRIARIATVRPGYERGVAGHAMVVVVTCVAGLYIRVRLRWL